MADYPKGTVSALQIMGWIFSGLGALYLLIGGLGVTHQPDAARTVMLVFAGIGAALLIAGGIFLYLEFSRRKRARELMASGRYVWAQVTGYRLNRAIEVNGRHPVILTLSHRDAQGQEHFFQSPCIRIPAGEYLLGKNLRVYYQDTGFRRYFVAAGRDDFPIS